MTSLSSVLLGGYRRTLGRWRRLDRAIKALVAETAIPALERARSFRTLPTDPLWFRLRLLFGAHEPATVAWIERLVRPGMTVCDVGAHVGYFTVRLARLVGPTGRVLAFEPHPATAAVLRANTRTYRNVEVVQEALGDSSHVAQLTSGGGDSSTFHLSATHHEPLEGSGSPIEAFEVQVECLDAWADRNDVQQLDLIKIDAEGHDLAVLRGTTSLLDRSYGVRVIIECAPRLLQAAGESPGAMLRALNASFDEVRVIAGPRSLLEAEVSTVTALAGAYGYVNLLAWRRG